MSETPLDRIQEEVVEQGKDIRELQTWRDEMKEWRKAQDGMRGHYITWCLAALAIFADVAMHLWGK